MSVKINYKKKFLKNSSLNLIFFVNEDYNLSSLKKIVSKNDHSFILDLIKSKNQKKEIITLEINSKKKIILIALKKDSKTSDIENLGAKLFKLSLDNKNNNYLIHTDTLNSKNRDFAGYLLMDLS